MASTTQAMSDPPAPSSNPRGRDSFRWVVCGLLFLATMVNYVDRQIIAILKPELSKELRWSESGYANIVAAFQFAYALGYLFGGRLMDRIGIRKGFPLAVGLWSLACAGHGVVRSVVGFSGARLCLGLAEGGNFPASIRAVAEWFPLQERALATGVFNSASNVGAIVCPLLVPFIVLKLGWPAAFYITGAAGLAWVALWSLAYRDLRERERGSESRDQAETAGWMSLLTQRTTWAYIVGQIMSGPVWWFYLFWLPDFLTKQYGLNAPQMGLRVSAVYAISILGSVAGGWISLVLLKSGMPRLAARKLAMLICAAAVAPVYFAPGSGSSWVAAGLVGLAAAAHQGFSANLYTFASDSIPKPSVASLVGLGGFASGMAAILVAKVVGQLLSTRAGYAPVFAWAASAYLVAVLIMHFLVPQEGRLTGQE